MRCGARNWPCPAGWRRQSAAMPEHACRAAIAAGWHDITPDSIRAAGPVNGHREAPADRGRFTGENPHGNQTQYVHDLFGERAARRPHSDAVISATGRLTYRQLDKSANQLARRLQGMGVGPETLVGVCLERGTQAIRCLLAILKSGGAYLPLDPSLPAARLTQMCGEARPLVILAGRAHAGTFSGAGATLLFPDELALPPADQPVTAPEHQFARRKTSPTPFTRQDPPAAPRRSPSATHPWRVSARQLSPPVPDLAPGPGSAAGFPRL